MSNVTRVHKKLAQILLATDPTCHRYTAHELEPPMMHFTDMLMQVPYVPASAGWCCYWSQIQVPTKVCRGADLPISLSLIPTIARLPEVNKWHLKILYL